jgi:endonuclease-3
VSSNKKERIRRILRRLYRTYPDAKCALRHSDALELLVATILSAQCTDVRVNQVTESLFRKYRTAREYAGSAGLEAEIRPAGFFRNKAKSIRGACRLIAERHGGRVPGSMEELRKLPGVGRKTANVVLGTWFGAAEGVVVDTHVRRIARRLELTRASAPEKVEEDLMRVLPRKDWIQFSHMVIWHGRKVCTARNPRCGDCPLANDCPSAGMV